MTQGNRAAARRSPLAAHVRFRCPLLQAVARTAVQALKVYFITACDEGGLSRKRQRLDGSMHAAAAAAPQPQQPVAASKQLLSDYSSFTSRLLQLLAAPAAPGLQVSALVALLECARHEEGPGACSGRIIGAVVDALVRGGGAAPEVFALLFSRYLPNLDVRYHALRAAARTARRIARGGGAPVQPQQQQQQKGKGSSSAAAQAQEEDEQADWEVEFDAAADGTALQARVADAARALFDVLAHIAPIRPGDDMSGATSWCGAAEVRGS